ncbi:MAG: hypothetical protein LBV67_08345 [Streptococcaceae bacterium]|jgi:hypothetical protein|nr:hypothetical protein [Streptococcaceae bacterium]
MEGNDFLHNQKEAQENLSDLLELVKALNWSIAPTTNRTQLEKQLNNCHVVKMRQYNNGSKYYELEVMKKDVENKTMKVPSYTSFNGLHTVSIYYGGIQFKEDKAETSEKNVPVMIKFIIDFLHGEFTFFNNHLYKVSGKQFKKMNENDLKEHYESGNKEGGFTVKIELLKWISNQLDIPPVKKMMPYQIACKDFIIDLKKREILHQPPNEKETYFKYFDEVYKEVKEQEKIYHEYLEMVINDGRSLHNARLQPIYMLLVACGFEGKDSFFISKSGVRTGKGLRHKIMKSVFTHGEIELDNLMASGITRENAISNLDGLEFIVATEQGEITPIHETVLKKIATERTFPGARRIQGNAFDAYVPGILSIDTNKTVALSREMDSRARNIAFKDRPKYESDIQRKNIFNTYWESFTINNGEKAKASSGLGMIINSFEYLKTCNNQFNFYKVEFDNSNSLNLDDFQMKVIDLFSKKENRVGGGIFLIYENFPELKELNKQTYQGVKKADKRAEAMEQIGVSFKKQWVNKEYGGKLSFKIESPERLNKCKNSHLKDVPSSEYL